MAIRSLRFQFLNMSAELHQRFPSEFTFDVDMDALCELYIENFVNIDNGLNYCVIPINDVLVGEKYEQFVSFAEGSNIKWHSGRFTKASETEWQFIVLNRRDDDSIVLRLDVGKACWSSMSLRVKMKVDIE